MVGGHRRWLHVDSAHRSDNSVGCLNIAPGMYASLQSLLLLLLCCCNKKFSFFSNIMEDVMAVLRLSITSSVPDFYNIDYSLNTYYRVDWRVGSIAFGVMDWLLQQLEAGHFVVQICAAMEAGPAPLLKLMTWLCKQVPVNYHYSMMAPLEEGRPRRWDPSQAGPASQQLPALPTLTTLCCH